MVIRIFDYALMFIVVVACAVVVVYRVRGGSVNGRGLPRGVSRSFVVFVMLCATALFVAKTQFGVLPSWIFHLLLAGSMSFVAMATYVDYKQKPTI
ncbi:MAG: hypothetical protein QOH88_475 [Verrucomicrobiota bacterium]|jgi:hypothetical protein